MHGNRSGGFCSAAVIVASAVIQNELISSRLDALPGPFFTHYYLMVMISAAVCLPILLFAKSCSSIGSDLFVWRPYYMSSTFWFGAILPLFLLGGLGYWSLRGTTPSAQNTIGQTNIVFVMAFSSLFLRAGCSRRHVACSTLSMVGAAIVAWSQGDDEHKNTSWGVALAFAAAATDAVYSISTEHLLRINGDGDGERQSFCRVVLRSLEVTVVFGVPTIIGTWPLLLLIDALDLEKIHLPGHECFQSIFLVWPWLFMYGIGFNAGVNWTSATFMVVGGSMVIPANILDDAVIGEASLTWFVALGAVSIVSSFALLPDTTNMNANSAGRSQALVGGDIHSS